jgi:hypothetical protein
MGHKPINTGAHIDMSQGLCLAYALRHEQVLPEILVFGAPTFFVTIAEVRVQNQFAAIAATKLRQISHELRKTSQTGPGFEWINTQLLGHEGMNPNQMLLKHHSENLYQLLVVALHV